MPRSRYAPRSLRVLIVQPFASPEDAWMWFMRCQQLRRDGARFQDTNSLYERPCDPDDVARVVIRLHRAGRIRQRHLCVLYQFGERGAAPDKRCREEENAARLWDEALDCMAGELKRKGIVA